MKAKQYKLLVPELITSPSNFQRLADCPGSAMLESSIPPPPSGPAAVRGTFLHEQLAHAFKGEPWGVDSTEDHALIVDAQARLEKAFALIDTKEDTISLIEHKVDLSCIGLRADRGTLDYAFVSPSQKTAVIIDFKSGHSDLPKPRRSWQMLLYAIGLLEQMPDLEEFHLQYNAPARPDLCSMETIDKKELLMLKAVAIEAVKSARHNTTLYIPSQSACKYCRGKAVCPALNEKAVAVVEESKVNPALPVGLALRSLDAAGKAAFYRKLLDAEVFIEMAKETLLAMALGGSEVEGFKCVAGRVMKRWRDEKEAKDFLVGMIGDKAFTKTLLTPAKAMKELGPEVVQYIEEVPGAMVLKEVK
jgi:hypothetical protein